MSTRFSRRSTRVLRRPMVCNSPPKPWPPPPQRWPANPIQIALRIEDPQLALPFVFETELSIDNGGSGLVWNYFGNVGVISFTVFIVLDPAETPPWYAYWDAIHPDSGTGVAECLLPAPITGTEYFSSRQPGYNTFSQQSGWIEVRS